MDWIYLDTVNITPDISSIHCDTRDFHVLLTQLDTTRPNDSIYKKSIDELMKLKARKKYILSQDDITKWLKTLETMTGGKGEWRSIFIKRMDGISARRQYEGWLKYIRFWRVSDTEFVVYTTSGEQIYFLDWSKVRDLINKDVEILNFMRD